MPGSVANHSDISSHLNPRLHHPGARRYEIAFTKGNASGAMCSYFAPNGVSCCGNNYLLNELVRGKWGITNAVIMSDCSAVANMQVWPLFPSAVGVPSPCAHIIFATLPQLNRVD